MKSLRFLFGVYTCKNKVQYQTRKVAWKKALQMIEEYNKLYVVYKCRYCKKFHCTTKHTTNFKPPKSLVKVDNS